MDGGSNGLTPGQLTEDYDGDARKLPGAEGAAAVVDAGADELVLSPRADIDADGWVGVEDLAGLAGDWLAGDWLAVGGGRAADVNRDGRVSLLDLAEVSSWWGWQAQWYVP